MSRWRTQAVVVNAGEGGLSARQVAEERGVGVGSVRRQLAHLERLGRLVRARVEGLRAVLWRPAPTDATNG